MEPAFDILPDVIDGGGGRVSSTPMLRNTERTPPIAPKTSIFLWSQHVSLQAGISDGGIEMEWGDEPRLVGAGTEENGGEATNRSRGPRGSGGGGIGTPHRRSSVASMMQNDFDGNNSSARTGATFGEGGGESLQSPSHEKGIIHCVKSGYHILT